MVKKKVDRVEDVEREDLDALAVRLEEAANLLLEQFTPTVKGFVHEIADVVLKIPRWQLVCGSLLAQHEQGSLPAPSLDPSWSTERTSTGTRVCETCGVMFEPFKPFQKYCTNDCGVTAQKKEKASGKLVAVAG